MKAISKTLALPAHQFHGNILKRDAFIIINRVLIIVCNEGQLTYLDRQILVRFCIKSVYCANTNTDRWADRGTARCRPRVWFDFQWNSDVHIIYWEDPFASPLVTAEHPLIIHLLYQINFLVNLEKREVFDS